MRGQQPKTKSGQRRYSLEDMKRWCDSMVESKTQLLLSQINENNSIIRILSEKLSKAEHELQLKDRMLEAMGQKVFQERKSDNVEVINKLLNDKLKDRFQYVNRVLCEIQGSKLARSHPGTNVGEYQTVLQQLMEKQIQHLKVQLKAKMVDIKSGNQKYWSKIKGWAKMFEEKERKCEQGIVVLHKEVKKLGQSVATTPLGMFKLKSFSGRLKEVQHAVYDLEQSFKLIGERQVQLKDLMDINEYRTDNIELSYSKDQSGVLHYTSQSRRTITNNDYYQTTSDEYFTNLCNPKSPRKELHNESDSVASSTIFKALSRKCSPLQDFSVLSSVKSDDGRTSFSSRIQSLQSMSAHIAHSRKAMVSSIKVRLQQLVSTKGISTPIRSHLDQLLYLKNEQNNYLFDCEGNMFKLSEQEYRELCLDGILMQF